MLVDFDDVVGLIRSRISEIDLNMFGFRVSKDFDNPEFLRLDGGVRELKVVLDCLDVVGFSPRSLGDLDVVRKKLELQLGVVRKQLGFRLESEFRRSGVCFEFLCCNF